MMIEEVVELMPEWRGKAISIEPLSGGITNSNFKIIADECAFFVSFPGRKARLLGIDWRNKSHNTRICGEAGLSPKVVQYFPEQNVLILEFLPHERCTEESLKRPAVQHRLIHAVKALHSGDRFWRDFDMFCLIEHYQEVVRDRKLVLPAGYSDYRKHIQAIGQALTFYREKLVPCHNDLTPENVLDDGNRIFLLDFDYSGNNDPCFDLGSISAEAGYNDAQVRDLASAYYGLASEQILARIHLHSILGDVGWSLWSVIQTEISEIDFDFIEYGLKRWNRAVERMESSEFDRLLRNVR